MSQEQVLNTLSNLGFDEIDAQIYVYLAKKGIQKASNITKALKLTKQQFYPSIKRLQNKGIVHSTMERPARFNVITFEKVIDLFIQAKIGEARTLKRKKAEILENWQNLKLEDDASAKFTIIEGRSFIYSKIHQIIQDTKNNLIAITSIPVLAQANQRDIFDAAYNHSSKKSIQIRFLTELSTQNTRAMKEVLNEFITAKLNIEIRDPDLSLAPFPHMLIKDEEEVLFFVKPRTETSAIEKNDTCLWTDCKTIVKAFFKIFEDIWHNSTSITERMIELETGKLAPRSLVIGDPEVAKSKYNKILNSAKEEILVLTSPKGLTELSQNIQDIHELTKKGVNVKIMAPITRQNIEQATQLSKFCSVAHIPPNYSPTTIVDAKHLFQFKGKIENPLETCLSKFESHYTNDPEYVKKNKNMLDELWKNSKQSIPQNIESTLKTEILSHCAYFPGAILNPGPHGRANPLLPHPINEEEYRPVELIDQDPDEKLTEQDILNDIIKAHKYPHKNPTTTFKVYASQAIALIHAPDFFNLPPMLIRIHHIEKTSTFGAEDAILISLLSETPLGSAYVPVAVFSDNPKAKFIWERHFEAAPAARNIQLAQKDELQVWVHGNTLFAGWTVPISLGSKEHVLLPACISIEGYGDVKTEAFSIVQSTGSKFTARQNGFDAFVTFMHPSSKYSGPGTDGFLVRDYIMEIEPQFLERFHPRLETKLYERKQP